MRNRLNLQLHLFILLQVFLPAIRSEAQTCAGLSVTYSVIESRCVSTGSIQINASGGSGNYEYKVTGPLVTAYTPSNNITGLLPGIYLVTIHDISNNCIYANDNVIVPGTYVDPTFNMTATTASCAGVPDGSITVTSQQFGRAPFSYKIIAPSPSGVGTVSASGVFNNLTSGTYFIQLSDSCGALQTRSVDVPAFGWKILNSSVTKVCDSIAVTLTLKDDNGNISPNPVFDGFLYGVLRGPGDTVWYNNNSFVYQLNHARRVTLIVRGSCGIIKTTVWIDTAIPSLDPLATTTNFGCTGFTGLVTGPINLSVLTQYCLFNSSNVQLSCNSTGVFNNIPYGSYCIKAFDPCYDTIITRCFAAARPIPAITLPLVINATCTGAIVAVTGQVNLSNPTYCLINNATNTQVTCNTSGVFDVPFGDYCINIINDPVCYDTAIVQCFIVAAPAPAVSIINLTCSTFSATIPVTSNLSNPQFCLYDAANNLVGCNTTGTFDLLPLGSYCMHVINNPFCFDTTYIICFTAIQPLPAVGVVNTKNVTCTFTATLTGQTGLSNPQFCLYDANNQLMYCNTTGVFDFVPLGSYCIKVINDAACFDTVITRCFTELGEPVDFTATSTPSCVLVGGTDISVNITSGQRNYNVSVYTPAGILVANGFTVANNKDLTLTGIPALPTGIQYKIVVTDLCGTKDSLLITPNYSILQRKKTLTAKCPSGSLPNGSADLVFDVTTNNIGGNIRPKITRKDGVTVNIGGNTGSNKYITTFTSLAPGTYVVSTDVANCNVTVFDTVVVKSYTFPSLQRTAAYTCTNGSVSINEAVNGGVSSYAYEIIGSEPASPSIIAGPTSNAVFNVNNGTNYSLIRLRATDACGNAALNDVGVLPLSTTATISGTDCFYNGLTLKADTIPNSTYAWYKKTSPTDSILVGTDITYTLPYLIQTDTGNYTAVINVNSGCLIKYAKFTVTGACGGALLPIPITLQAQQKDGVVELNWLDNADESIMYYEVERSNVANGGFKKIQSVTIGLYNGDRFSWKDINPAGGDNFYRLKIVYRNGDSKYSNTVLIKITGDHITIGPNPAKDKLIVAVRSKLKVDYLITIHNLLGQSLYSQRVSNIQSQDIYLTRDYSKLKPGVYLVVVTSTVSQERVVAKIIME